MSNGIDDSMAEVLNGLPGRVSNRLLLGAIIETRTQLRGDVDRLSKRVESFEDRLTKVERLAEKLTQVQKESPSMLSMVRDNPVVIVRLFLVTLSVMLATVGIVRLPEWISLLLEFFGG